MLASDLEQRFVVWAVLAGLGLDLASLPLNEALDVPLLLCAKVVAHC